MTDPSMRRRWRMFAALVGVAGLVLVAAIWRHDKLIGGTAPAPVAREQTSPAQAAIGTEAPATNPPGSAPVEAPPQAVAPAVPRPAARWMFHRYTGLDNHYGRLAYRNRDGDREYSESMSCDVVYVGGGRGICLSAKRGVVTTYLARLFDAATLEPYAEFPLAGAPSRSRVSTDGRLAAYTVFITGHGYTTLDFSTQSVILDATTGAQLLDLEQDFTVLRDGEVIKDADFNFWGITFTPDASGFYATLSTNRRHYLVAGNIAAKTMTVVHENVECPSLSPDGTRVAYKKRFVEGGRILWQLQVLDLATMAETVIAERRSIDDQLEWLDDSRVLYSVPQPDDQAGGGTDVWVAQADGTRAPGLFLARAYSPSVGR